MLKKRMPKCGSIVTMCALAISAHAAADTRSHLNLPAGELVSALKALAQQSDVDLVYEPEQLRRIHTNGVKGEYTAQEAVAILLKATAFRVYLAPGGAMVITPASMEQSSNASPTHNGLVPASSTRGGTDTGRVVLAQAATSSTPNESTVKTNRPQLEEVTVFGRGVRSTVNDVPQTVNVFDAEFIENVQAKKITDVVRFTPNLVPSGSSNVLYDDVRSRGFPSSFTWNGMARRFTNGTLKMANVERVEVLKGPASVLYGPMEPGAVVNLVTKRPQSQFGASGSLQFGSDNEQNYSMDIGGPLTEKIGARLNTAYFKTDTAFDNSGLEDIFVAPVVEFRFSDRTVLTLDGYYDKVEWADGYSDGRVPVIGGLVPNPVGRLPLSTNLQYDTNITAPEGYGEVSIFYSDLDANARFSHEFSDSVSLNVALSHHRARGDREQIQTGLLAANNRTLGRSYTLERGGDYKTEVAHLDLKWSFSTGAVTHDVAVGVDHTKTDSDYSYAFIGITPIDIFTPVYGTIVLPNVIPFDEDNASTKVSEAFVQDRLSLGRFHVLGGARYSDYESQDRYQVFQGALRSTDMQDQIWSTQFGLLYDAADWITLFASRNESFVPRLANIFGRGSVVQPELGLQYEVGAKLTFSDSGFSGNVVFFDIDKDNLLVFDEAHPGFRLPLGGVSSKGFEISLEGSPSPGLSMYVGYGYNSTEITKADANVGNSFYHVPKQTLSAYVSYEIQDGLARGLALTTSMQHVGERFASDDNLYKWPSYTRVDLGATYPVTDRVQVGMNIRNLLESTMYSGFGAVRVTRDPFRTVMGTVSFRY
ncbi:TonB-dependent siderophore receptor [Steroidobacter sp.]|uniref:TonB-dependent siderophore receptor n=1 Tax=Steroidobacter sp. TaxID=1978227 RepID=UPI001A59D244|nr:TonB-dependent receptor [Steroidobacter sp.]MBL8267909.1 TonB-dependent receptor [Steroidobacter sp.]